MVIMGIIFSLLLSYVTCDYLVWSFFPSDSECSGNSSAIFIYSLSKSGEYCFETDEGMFNAGRVVGEKIHLIPDCSQCPCNNKGYIFSKGCNMFEQDTWINLEVVSGNDWTYRGSDVSGGLIFDSEECTGKVLSFWGVAEECKENLFCENNSNRKSMFGSKCIKDGDGIPDEFKAPSIIPKVKLEYNDERSFSSENKGSVFGVTLAFMVIILGLLL